MRSSKLGTVTRRFDDFNIPAGNVIADDAACNAGERMLAGGGEYLTADGQVVMISSFPDTSNTWEVRAFNQSGLQRTVRVWVLCLQT